MVDDATSLADTTTPFDPAAAVRELVDVAAGGRDPWVALAAYARSRALSEDQVQQIRTRFIKAFVERALSKPPRYRRFPRRRGPAC